MNKIQYKIVKMLGGYSMNELLKIHDLLCDTYNALDLFDKMNSDSDTFTYDEVLSILNEER